MMYDPSTRTSPTGKKHVSMDQQLWRTNHPYDMQSNRMISNEQYVKYEKFQTQARRFGRLGRGNCNQQFLYEGSYPAQDYAGEQEDNASTFMPQKSVKRDTL